MTGVTREFAGGCSGGLEMFCVQVTGRLGAGFVTAHEHGVDPPISAGGLGDVLADMEIRPA
ncbi:MAG TPA: hypothetical protein DIW80_11320 [Gordonia polyisoprenivorans]|nr:hypothetical protein CJJ17_00565 [Gordonia polyisoprenivorans]HCS57723.1 hypothetical protein [Gordonia polyisoprenivorans]